MSVHLIRKLEQFVRLSQAEKRALERLGRARLRHFPARADIAVEGESPDAVNLILDGWACRYKALEDGRRQIVSFFVPGDMSDLNSFILRQLDHSQAAVTPVIAAEISRDMLDEITDGHPRVVQAFWWETLVTASIQREWTLSLGQRTAAERLAHLFCELFIRLRSVGLTDGDSCDFPVPQTALAEAAGLSPVHVNRTLMTLREAGLLSLARRQLTIPDLGALMSAGLFNPNYLHLEQEGRHLDANL